MLSNKKKHELYETVMKRFSKRLSRQMNETQANRYNFDMLRRALKNVDEKVLTRPDAVYAVGAQDVIAVAARALVVAGKVTADPEILTDEKFGAAGTAAFNEVKTASTRLDAALRKLQKVRADRRTAARTERGNA